MTAAHAAYALGHDESELDRLISQSRFLGDLTEHVLGLAGLRPGMRVVDVGCGAGDVTFLAARMVGADGFVTGMDRSAEAIERARDRAAQSGLSNVAFTVGDAADVATEPKVDAIIGRLVLMYAPDPAELLRRLSESVAPGGLLVFQEMDMGGAFATPEAPLFELTVERTFETFRRVGAGWRTGLQLHRIFQAAGLPAPKMIQGARVEAGPDSPVYAQLAGVVRTLLPHMETTGVATREEVDIDTLADRLRAEGIALDTTVVWPPLIGAWTTVG